MPWGLKLFAPGGAFENPEYPNTKPVSVRNATKILRIVTHDLKKWSSPGSSPN
jgi:hypothetical protein